MKAPVSRNKEAPQSEGLLSPYRVLDLTDEKGLLCGRILGDLGADVIKVERPGGDPARNIGPFYHDIIEPEKSLFWFAFNTNKRGITLNIETADGCEIFKSLVSTADFVIESFPPSYIASLGLSYPILREVNPRLIMVSLSPFGQTGPYAHFESSDMVIHAMGGLMTQCGDPDRPPVQVSVPQSFISAATDAAAGAMVAHYYREITGKGQQVDVSAMDSVAMNGVEGLVEWTVGKSIFNRRGRLNKLGAGLFSPIIWECKDGYASYFFMGSLPGARANQRLVEWMNSEGMAPEHLRSIDWENLGVEKLTQQELDYITKTMAKFFKTHTKAEIQEEAAKRLIMIYPVHNSGETLMNPQLESRSFWVNINHDELNEVITYPGAFAKFSETPIREWRRAPLIGEHNQEIYMKELGMSKDELIALKGAGVI